ncbi:hypothetical protein [Flavobacterium sp. '19STA2R22 D10 B1']|uniref:hypothetical protein n=1 Tax=Flavobacterium aerium TaxID=3037261 RepID=UPI0035577A02
MTSESVAEHLEQLINHYAAQGWNYIRLEDARAYVQPTGGCFGFWQTPGFTIHRQMVVFSR